MGLVLLVNDQTNLKKKKCVAKTYLSVAKKFFREKYFIFFHIMNRVWTEQAITKQNGMIQNLIYG